MEANVYDALNMNYVEYRKLDVFHLLALCKYLTIVRVERG